MPRKRKSIHNYYEDDENDDNIVICRQENCEKRLRKHAGNLERHLKTLHPSIYEAHISEEEPANNTGDEQQVKRLKKEITPPVRPTRSLLAPPPKFNHNLIEKAAELWIIKLQSMEATQALISEKLINDIISNGQLGNLNKNSSIQIGLKISDPLGSVHYQNGACDESETLMREEFIEMNQSQKQSFD